MKCPPSEKVEARCSYFKNCGGCAFQDISYSQELFHKRERMRLLLQEAFPDIQIALSEVVPSPQEYHYRHRLDIGMRRTKEREMVFGFVNQEGRRLVEIDSCAIARKEISDFLPQLKQEAIQKWPEDYRVASLCVRVGDEGKVRWGGIGRRSLQLREDEYFYADILGKKVFYSLDTFFQNNHFILPDLFKTLFDLYDYNSKTVFLDLYGGVGLFSILLADRVQKVLLVEESKNSVKLAQFNKQYYQYDQIEIIQERVENCLQSILVDYDSENVVAMIDPPRKGLYPSVCEALVQSQKLKTLFYLSCHPDSLIRDLKILISGGWKIETVIPFDFFPKTVHLETLVKLIR